MVPAPIPNDPYVIHGIRTGSYIDPVTHKRKWPPRRDIDEMMTAQDQKHAILFLVALKDMQDRSLNGTLSFFQIAGIHGYPVRPWPREDGPGTGSYCEHRLATFTTWHRIHMLLFEQIMHEIVMSLVEPSSTKIPIKDEERQAWREAAETWRLPYWDPGVRRSYNDDYSCIPRSAMNEISVDPPTNPGGPTLIFTENPLYAYRYPLIPPDNLKQHGMVDYLDPKTGDVTAPFTIQRRTVRYAPSYNGDEVTTASWTNGTGDINRLKKSFRNVTVRWREELQMLMGDTDDFHLFVIGNPNAPDSSQVPTLNGIHGDVHDITGGDISGHTNQPTPTTGNMSFVAGAAFDPIFFLWHANVDRWIAMWQAGHPADKPEHWLTPTEDLKPLYPFVASGATGNQLQWWQSKDCRSLDNLGYSYEVCDKIHDKVSLQHALYDMYNDWSGEVPLKDYIVTAAFAANEPFRMSILLTHNEETHEVGRIVNFAASPEDGCGNCAEQDSEGLVVTSSTIISPALRDLEAQTIIHSDYESVMQKGLHWGDKMPASHYASMKIGITRRDKQLVPVPPPGNGSRGPGGPESEFTPPTKLVRAVPLRGITAGKDGGLGQNEHYV